MIAPAYPGLAARRHGSWQPDVGEAPCQARLIVGYGNDLRCDDAAGICAATMIAAQDRLARVIVCHQLTPDLACDIALAAQVVFIDAYAADVCSAGLRVEQVFAGDAADTDLALVHRTDPAQLLGLARRLFGRAPEAWMVGIPAFCFAVGGTISAETARRIDEAVALFRE